MTTHSHHPQSWPQLWHHLHNSFLFLETQGAVPLSISSVQALIAPHPVDGLALIEPPKSNLKVFNLKGFFNRDGSPAKYCGNAHICLATLAWERGVSETQFGTYHLLTTPTELGPFCYRLSPFPWSSLPATPVDLPGGRQGWHLTFGVPHVILEVPQSAKSALVTYQQFSKSTLLAIQNDKQFPEGTNVTFLLRDAQQRPCGNVSFERGLRTFSNACSSGMFACIVYALQQQQLRIRHRFSWETLQDRLELQVEDGALLIYSKAHRLSTRVGANS